MSNRRKMVATILTLGCVMALSSGCQSTYKFMKAKPAEDSGFLEDPARLEERTNFFPYGRYWCDWEALKGFSKIAVAPVDTSHLLERSSWQKFNTTRWSGYDKDVENAAKDLGEAFENAIREDPDGRFTLVDDPGEEGLILELALVELVPSKVLINAASKAAGFLVPGAGAVAMLGSASVAMEGRLRAAATDQIVCSFADREKAKASLIYLPDYTWYGNVRRIADEWAEQFVEIASAENPVEDVEDSRPIRFRPW